MMGKYYFNYKELLRSDLMEPPYIGRGWKIDFIDTTDEHLNIRNLKLPIITCKTFEGAINASLLIFSSTLIIDPNPLLIRESFFPKEKLKLRGDKYFSFLGANVIQKACILASKISHSRKFSYAICKLARSYENICINAIDLDPYHSDNIDTPSLNKPNDIYLDVMKAEAINLAYSAIEEMGLKPIPKDVQSNSQKTTKINGQWGIKSKNDLQQRLKKSGISEKTKFVWMARNKRVFIENQIPFSQGKKIKWSDGYKIRDFEIDLIDALANASFIRNKVTTHYYGDYKNLKTLSVYDVRNIQDLARELFLLKYKIF